jgi:hypothetical protein
MTDEETLKEIARVKTYLSDEQFWLKFNEILEKQRKLKQIEQKLDRL